jgi:hypothetical protein
MLLSHTCTQANSVNTPIKSPLKSALTGTGHSRVAGLQAPTVYFKLMKNRELML